MQICKCDNERFGRNWKRLDTIGSNWRKLNGVLGNEKLSISRKIGFNISKTLKMLMHSNFNIMKAFYSKCMFRTDRNYTCILKSG